MLVDILKGLEKIVRESSDIVIVDFNCKEINWETMTTNGSENSWSNRLIKLGGRNLDDSVG